MFVRGLGVTMCHRVFSPRFSKPFILTWHDAHNFTTPGGFMIPTESWAHTANYLTWALLCTAWHHLESLGIFLKFLQNKHQKPARNHSGAKVWPNAACEHLHYIYLELQNLNIYNLNSWIYMSHWRQMIFLNCLNWFACWSKLSSWPAPL